MLPEFLLLFPFLASCLAAGLAPPTQKSSGSPPSSSKDTNLATNVKLGDVFFIRGQLIINIQEIGHSTKPSKTRSDYYRRKDFRIHPAVVLSGPDSLGQYQLAYMSHNMLGPEPKKTVPELVPELVPGTAIDGYISTHIPLKVKDLREDKRSQDKVPIEGVKNIRNEITRNTGVKFPDIDPQAGGRGKDHPAGPSDHNKAGGKGKEPAGTSHPKAGEKGKEPADDKAKAKGKAGAPDPSPATANDKDKDKGKTDPTPSRIVPAIPKNLFGSKPGTGSGGGKGKGKAGGK